MTRVLVELEKNSLNFDLNFPTYTRVYTVTIKTVFETLFIFYNILYPYFNIEKVKARCT